MPTEVLIAVGVTFVLFAVAWVLVPFALRKRAERRLAEMCRSRRAVVLTYDDGPGPGLTPQLLDVLREAGVKATFFMIGRNADSSPDLARRVVLEGHDAGSHTYRHRNAWKTAPWTAARDVLDGMVAIDTRGGDGRHFRPPFGKLTLAGLAQGARRKLRFGWWTVDSRDSWARRPIPEVLMELREKGGGVVLMHDFDRFDRAPTNPPHPVHVLELTRRIIGLARAEHFTILTLSELRPIEGGANA